jgi:S1-C subfamily serine protease
MNWIGLNGRHHGEYWLLKSDTFDVDLDPIDEVFTGSITRISRHASSKAEDELSIEDLIARTKTAVVYLRGVDKVGTGFFVTQTGVIVTNAHVARNQETLALIMSGGIQIDAKVVYVDDDLDIALLKVAGNGFPFLPLADTSSVRQGDTVFAIGNPGDGMKFSVTRGIVSAVGLFPSAGRGTWIQTDAQINPGNSGGPLLNAQGEVIGISTQKVSKKNVSGISFALSAGDALSVMSKFYHEERVQLSAPSKIIEAPKPPEVTTASVSAALEFGTVLFSDPIHADIFVDGVLVGQVPATLSLAVGLHDVVVKRGACALLKRHYYIEKGSSITIAPPAWNVPVPNNGCHEATLLLRD